MASLNRWIERAATAMALLGGAMLTGLVVLVCASVAGRELNELLRSDWLADATWARWLIEEVGLGAINGDFELVEAGMAFAIFAFLPLTHLTAGHAKVDLLANRMPPTLSRWLDLLIEALFAAVLILIAVQLWGGLQTKFNAGQTTLRLQYPVWWGYALAFVPAVQAATTAVFTTMRTAQVAWSGTAEPTA